MMTKNKLPQKEYQPTYRRSKGVLKSIPKDTHDWERRATNIPGVFLLKSIRVLLSVSLVTVSR